MKKKLSIFLALVLAISMIVTTVVAFAEPAEAPVAESEGESAESEGESAEDAAPVEDAESAESDGTAEDAVEPAAEGESAEREGESEGQSGGGGGLNGGFATEETDPEALAEKERLEQRLDYVLIPAEGEQAELGYLEGVTTILEVDGLKFKDLNKNGELDIYEDWRCEIDDRVADLISQMTVEEEAGLLFCVNTQLVQACAWLDRWNLTCQLFNLNGNPLAITNTLNNIQAHAEEMRLGVPMVFTSDREYNAWGGYIDKAHDAFGTAYDPELAYELACFYGKAMRAIGIHVTFEPYAEEIGAQYGENPELIANVVHQEILGLEENGLASCTKHWIGRGGDSSFGNARSIAQNFDNWMVGWKAALSAGSEWVMTNCGGTGITNTTDPKWDSVTMGYLRNELGFDGVVVTDWWALGLGQRVSGITVEGVDLAEQSGRWLYNRALELGTDMFGAESMMEGEDWESNPMANWPEMMVNGINDGDILKENVDRAATNILRFKFRKGLFENPYCDVDAALELCASEEWIAEQWEIETNEDLRKARNPYEVELTEKLQAESAVLVKNDDGLLPLKEGIKVYFDCNNADRLTGYKTYLAAFAEIVDDPEEADVMVGDFSQVDDVCELFLDDAADFGKPAVVTMNLSDPTAYVLENADAVLYLSYSQQADHGKVEPGFIVATEPWIYADLLFGVREPGGVIVKELTRNTVDEEQQWKDLAGDYGASPYVRLMIQATMEDDTEYHASPNNWGDPLVQAYYGMRYGAEPEFKYSCLILPMTTEVVEEEVESSGEMSIQTSAKTFNKAIAGEPFTAYVLLRNNGADGITTVEAYVDGELAAEKMYTVCGGSWRVIEMEITVDEPGEHEITIGDQTATLTVGE